MAKNPDVFDCYIASQIAVKIKTVIGTRRRDICMLNMFSVRMFFLNLFQNHEEKEPFGPGCRDYFWLICHLIDGITKEDVEVSFEQVCFSNF